MSNRLSDRWRMSALLAVTLILGVVVVGQFATGMTAGALVRAVLYVTPALLPLRGLLKRNRYTYRWATLCVLPYFVVALTEAFANAGARAWATTLLGAALLWFISLVFFLRATTPRPELLVSASEEGAPDNAET